MESVSSSLDEEQEHASSDDTSSNQLTASYVNEEGQEDELDKTWRSEQFDEPHQDPDQNDLDPIKEADSDPEEERSLPEVLPSLPEDFDARSFLRELEDLEIHIRSNAYNNITMEFPSEDLCRLVEAVTTTMSNFRDYSQHTQNKMEAVRSRVRQIRDNMHRYIQAKTNEIALGK